MYILKSVLHAHMQCSTCGRTAEEYAECVHVTTTCIEAHSKRGTLHLALLFQHTQSIYIFLSHICKIEN